MQSRRVLVGISGGIDSTATVLMLREAGYSVEALYIDMLDCEVSRASVRELCDKLSVKLHIADASSDFKELVIDRVIDAHNRGETPSPCTLCNPEIKWKLLEQYGDRLGIEYLATGHYIGIEEHEGWFYVTKGIDPTKDQSYYLYSLGQEILRRAITPLGVHTKASIREYLTQRGYPEVCAKPESQGVCFAKSGYRDFLLQHTTPTSGDVIDQSGNTIGTHSGYQLYTIGQKRGFYHSLPHSVEVREVVASSNELIAGTPLLTDTIELRDGWFHPTSTEIPITVKIRGLGRNPLSSATVYERSEGRLAVKINTKEFWAPAPGQPAVLFQGDRVVGGGVLK